MEYSEDSPDKKDRKSPPVSDDSPFIGYLLLREFGKSSSKRSLTREDFEAMKRQRQKSDSEEDSAPEDIESEQDEEDYEEEFEEEAGQSSIASDIA